MRGWHTTVGLGLQGALQAWEDRPWHCCPWAAAAFGRDHLPWETSYLSSTQTHPGLVLQAPQGAGVGGGGSGFSLLPYHPSSLPPTPFPSPASFKDAH